MTTPLTPEQSAEVMRLQAYFPFRRVFVATPSDNQRTEVFASATRARALALTRKGWAVFEVTR